MLAPRAPLTTSPLPGISRRLATLTFAPAQRRSVSGAIWIRRGGTAPCSSRRRAFDQYCIARRYQSNTTTAHPIAEALATTPTSNTPVPPIDPPAQPPRLKKSLTTTAFVLAAFAAGFAMSAAPAADTVNGFLKPPTDAETLNLYEPKTQQQAEINEHILTHPLAVRLRAQEGVSESRPHLKIPEAMRAHNLTSGVMMGEGKIEVPPVFFVDAQKELPTLTQISYLGPSLCGHPGMIHGGCLATLLDEGLARACFPALPNKVAVTASLKIDYRAPCPAGSYVVLKAHTTKVEGRKAWVTGWIEALTEDGSDGTKLVEAEALFIEPKGAKNMARIYSTQ